MRAAELPTVVGLLVQKVADGSFGARDRLQDYLRREPQGAVTLAQAARINAILAQHGHATVEVPEAASVGTAEQMVAEHLAVDKVWNGTGYAPMPQATREARARALDDMLDQVRQIGVDAASLSPHEQLTLRELLAMAARGLT